MKKIALLSLAVLSTSAFAYEARFVKGEITPDLETLLQKASAQSGVTFSPSDMMKVEERELATSKFMMFVQTVKKVPVARTAVRIWTDIKTGELIQAEMHLDEKAKTNKDLLETKFEKAHFSQSALKSKQLRSSIEQMVNNAVMTHETDARVISMKSKDQWENGDFVRVVEVRARRGLHTIKISLLKNEIVEQNYREFPKADHRHESAYMSLSAPVYPIYEKAEGTGEILKHEIRELKYLKTEIPDGGMDPFVSLRNRTYSEATYNPILAATVYGRSQGAWSEGMLRGLSQEVLAKLGKKPNNFQEGLLLQGKFVNINLHPDVKEKFKEVEFPLLPGTAFMTRWVYNNGWEAKPSHGVAGKEINSEADLLNRLPVISPSHDPVTYINSGFDEVQVYYGVTVLMDALNEMGMTDPELSSTPFDAFLFDPDIGMKDNAYYYDNTINFTTYNPEEPNLARDNPTIWHELGHGVMDRIMGPHLAFEGGSGYGGLSEGMADFLAILVVEHQTDGANFPGKDFFRIVNETGFYHTNEFHDEGEAYGGVMYDILKTVIANEGREGLFRMTDLTMETMRLTRNHPGLSPASWFVHMLYADERGSATRPAGSYKDIILSALQKRNFSFEAEFKPSNLLIKTMEGVLDDKITGSRENPHVIKCTPKNGILHPLTIQMIKGDNELIEYPVTIKVEFKKGALQGAIAWAGEENNPLTYTINSAEEILNLKLGASSKCDKVNQEDDFCKDYAYVQAYLPGKTKPIAKKRYYLKIKNKAPTCRR